MNTNRHHQSKLIDPSATFSDGGKIINEARDADSLKNGYRGSFSNSTN